MAVKTTFTSAEDLFIWDHLGKISASEIGHKLKRSRHAIRNRRIYLQQEFRRWLETIREENESKKVEQVMMDDEQVITCIDEDVRTVQDLIRVMKIDMKEWRIEKAVCNKWGGFARTESYKAGPNIYRRKLTKVPLYQVKVWLARIDPITKSNVQLREQLIEDLKKYAPQPRPIRRIAVDRSDELMAEVDIPDHHFAKMSWGEETGAGNFDLKIASQLFTDAVESHANRLSGMGVSRILLPLGNDLFHSDDDKNQTNQGTPQDVDGRWQKAWIAAKRVVTTGIETLRQIAPVDIVVVPGNHDRMKAWLFGDLIATHFAQYQDVRVNNSPTLRKYIEWGTVLLGFTHGSEERHQSLPGIMANEQREAWARTSHREFHIGHLHTRRETRFNANDVHDGVHVRILPSLCEADAWHAMRGYIGGPRASEMYLWRKQTGFAGMMVHTPRL